MYRCVTVLIEVFQNQREGEKERNREREREKEYDEERENKMWCFQSQQFLF